MIEDLKSSLFSVLLIVIGWLLGLITAKITFKQTRELEKRKILQEKIEELAETVYKLEDGYRAILGKILLSTATGKEIENLDKDALNNNISLPFPLIRILIDFYFPELKPVYKELIDKGEEFGKQLPLYLNEKDRSNRTKVAAKILLKSEEIDTVCEKIISISSGIAQRFL